MLLPACAAADREMTEGKNAPQNDGWWIFLKITK